jgi:hypothetical protein
MLDQLKMDYLTGCYRDAEPKDRGMCAIQAVALAWANGSVVPGWAMLEIGNRFYDYFQANTAEGVKKQLSLDSFFETQRAFQRMNTNERDDEQIRRIFHFEKLFSLKRNEAIAVLEAAGLLFIKTKEGKGEGDKHVERRGKAHAVNRKAAAALHDPYANLFDNRVLDGSIDLDASRQQVFDSLLPAAQKLIKDFQRNK